MVLVVILGGVHIFWGGSLLVKSSTLGGNIQVNKSIPIQFYFSVPLNKHP